MSTTSRSPGYTGRLRRKQTSWTVRLGDAVAKWLIAIGGIGTIVAVSLVFLFLFSVAVPLFFPARLTNERWTRIAPESASSLADSMDEFRRIEWTIASDGKLRVTRIDTGEVLADRSLLDGAAPTVISQAVADPDVAVGAADGTVRFGNLGFATTIESSSESLPAEAEQLEPGESLTHEQGVYERTAQGLWRLQRFEVALGNPISLAKSALRRLDHLTLTSPEGLGGKSHLIAFYTDDGACRLCKIEEQENQFTGEKTLAADAFDLPLRRPPEAELLRVMIAGRGDNVYLAWTNGMLQRLDIRDTGSVRIVEESNLLGPGGGELIDCRFLLGRETLIVADSNGGLRGWFRTRRQDDASGDGQRLTMVHDLTAGGVAASTLRPSERGRSVIVGYTDGMVRVFHVTTEKRIVEKRVADGEPIRRVAFAPKEDGLIAATGTTLWTANYDPRHPEATLASLFQRVWYEGYDQPLHVWQSSSATSAPEMKLGLMPLVFGTLKATFYTMLFATPLALLGAIFTSEFMHPRTRGWIKPSIEMMASLPSVVLGFLAALVFAPIIKTYATATITTLFTAPFLYLLAAHLWQALPQRLIVRWQQLRFGLLFLPLPVGIAVWVRPGTLGRALAFCR